MVVEKRKLILFSIYLLPFIHSIVVTTLWSSPTAEFAQTLIKGSFSAWLILIGLACINSKSLHAIISAKALLAYLVLSIISVIWTVDVNRTLMAVFGLVSLLMLAVAAVRVSSVEISKVLLSSCDSIIILSILAYVIEINGAVVHLQGVDRLSGITFGPHALGRIVVLAILLRYYLHYRGVRSTFSTVLCLALVYGFVLYLTDSRQAFIVIIPSLFAVWILTGNSKLKTKKLTAFTLLILMVIPFLNVGGLVGDNVQFLNRSASDDITTLTGRTYIWAKSIELIGSSPFIGYGLHGGGLVLTENYATDTSGWTTESAHNVFLQTALDIGLIGVSLLALVFISAIRSAFVSRNSLALSLVVFVMILGIVERSIAGAPGFLNFLFFYGVLLTYSRIEYKDV